MRFVEPLIIAGALVTAAPAQAQDNVVAPANAAVPAPDANVAAPAVDANATVPVTDLNTAVPAEPVAPVDENAAAPAAPAPDNDRGFPWGVLGVIGLIGLLGVRKVKG
jgi:hypothetical protein